jgi:hypothetical protein
MSNRIVAVENMRKFMVYRGFLSILERKLKRPDEKKTRKQE